MNKVTVSKRYLTLYATNGILKCSRCGKQLCIGDTIYVTQKRNSRYKGFRHSKSIKHFYCQSCLDIMYFDSDDKGLDSIQLKIQQ